MNLPNILKSVRLSLLFFFLFGFSAWGQNLSGFQTPESEHTGKNTIVLVGGNAINSKAGTWEWFGADGYAPDARVAIDLAKKLITD